MAVARGGAAGGKPRRAGAAKVQDDEKSLAVLPKRYTSVLLLIIQGLIDQV